MLVEEYNELSKISFKELNRLKKLNNVLLIGDWAAHFLTNDKYREWKNIDYIGSKDVDFGVRKKDFNKVSEKLIKFGYTPINFRFYKIFDRESKKEISENESKKRPLFKNFYLYVDLVLDEQIKGKTTFFNDKIIKFSFENKLWLDKNGFKVIKPELLVLIKIRILESRDEEKRLKDVLDSLFISNFSNLDIDFFRQLKEKFGINEVNIDIARKILDSRELDLELSGLRFDSVEIRSIKTSFISLLNF